MWCWHSWRRPQDVATTGGSQAESDEIPTTLQIQDRVLYQAEAAAHGRDLPLQGGTVFVELDRQEPHIGIPAQVTVGCDLPDGRSENTADLQTERGRPRARGEPLVGVALPGVDVPFTLSCDVVFETNEPLDEPVSFGWHLGANVFFSARARRAPDVTVEVGEAER